MLITHVWVHVFKKILQWIRQHLKLKYSPSTWDRSVCAKIFFKFPLRYSYERNILQNGNEIWKYQFSFFFQEIAVELVISLALIDKFFPCWMEIFWNINAKVVNILYFPASGESFVFIPNRNHIDEFKWNLLKIIGMLITAIFHCEILPNAWLFHKDQIYYGHAHSTGTRTHSERSVHIRL